MIGQALDQVGLGPCPGRNVLVRIDGAGSTHETIKSLVGRKVLYSVGFTLPMDTAALYHLIPEQVWTPAVDSDGRIRAAAEAVLPYCSGSLALGTNSATWLSATRL